jgi:uncharacterized protein (TIGR00369 family)
MRRLSVVFSHVCPPSVSMCFSDVGGGVVVLDGDLEEEDSKLRFLQSRVRIGTEFARVKLHGHWVGVADGVFLRVFTHHVRRADLGRVVVSAKSDKELMQLASPISSVRSLVGTNLEPLVKRADSFQQVFNAWQETPKFACFGCAPSPSSFSLKLIFFDGPNDSVYTEHFATAESFPGVCHGGVLATIADDLSYFAFVKHNKKTMAMTKSLSMEYLKPVATQQFVSGKATCSGNNVRVEISNSKGQLCCVATVVHLVPKQSAVEPVKLNL